MAIRDDFFTSLSKGARWDVGVSIKRSNPLPLDDKSVFGSYADLETYAAGVLAYPGQVVAVVEESKTVIYYLDQNLAIQPVGIIPSGDDKTIEVTEEGVISLKGAAQAAAGQQPRIVNKGTEEAPKLELEWFTPDNSDVVELQEAIGALEATVDGVVAEDGSVTTKGLTHKVADLEDKVGHKATGTQVPTGLYAIISEEIVRAQAAEGRLSAAISAIDFVDDDELAEAIKDFETKENVKKVSDDLAGYISSNDSTLASVKATAEAAATKAYTDEELAKKADKAAYEQTVSTLNEVKGKVEAFLEGTGASDAIDSLQELINYINTHDDTDIAGILSSISTLEGSVEDNAEAIAAIIDEANGLLKQAKDYTDGEIDKLEEVVNGKADATHTHTDAQITCTDYEGQTLVNVIRNELAKKSHTHKAADITDFSTEVNKVITDAGVATDEALAAMGGRITKLEEDSATHATKTELNTAKNNLSIAIGDVTGGINMTTNTNATNKVLDERLTAVEGDLVDINSDITTLGDKVTTIEESINGTTGIEKRLTTVADKVVTLESSVATAQSTADKGVSDAAAAQSTANEAKATTVANSGKILALEKTVNGWSPEEGEQGEVVVGLTSQVANHEVRLGTAEGTISGHTTQIDNLNKTVAKKAEQSDLSTLTNQFNALNLQVNDETSGLVTISSNHTSQIADLDTRLKAEEAKADNDTTYTFENGTEGTFKVTPKGGSAQTVETGAKAYTDAEIKKVTDVMATDAEVAVIKKGLEDSIDALAGENGRVTVAESEIDALQETIKGLSGAMHFKGVVESDPTGKDFDVSGYATGDVVIFGNKEYVFSTSSFIEFGDATGNASAISELDGRVQALESVDHAKAHEATLKSAKDYADDLAGDYATAAQGAKADSAIQSVGAGAGLKVTTDKDDNTKLSIDFDDSVVFVFDGGSASSNW